VNFQIRKLDAYPLYLVMEGATALLMTMIFTASSIYQVSMVGLSALQLVLVGTTLEVSAFLFEVPTGVVADVYSRRLSVIIGMFLVGLGFIVEGAFPLFLPILLAQVLWGVGYTFTSGATQAWITDEIGEAAAGKAFLRSNQVGNLTALFGIGAGMLLGTLRINLPILLGGGGMLLLGIFLALCMPETGFKPAPREERGSWGQMLHTFVEGLRMVRRRPALGTILGIGLIYGLYSEGLDRLWTKHMLDQFALPLASLAQPVVWLGLMRALGLLLSIGGTELVQRRVNTENSKQLAQTLLWITLLLVAGVFGFALAGTLLLAVLAYWLVYVTRNVIGPLYTAWVNQRLDSQVRATVISMSSQVDAIGQIAGGPAVGLIGSLISVRAALLASGVILTPALALFRFAIRRGESDGEPGGKREVLDGSTDKAKSSA
jgi:DHA3 family tetracycline resistance protein-like MFS transporter